MTPRTVACQASLSMGFSRQEYWRGLPFPSPGDLLHPGIEPESSVLQVDSLPTELRGKLYIYGGPMEKNKMKLARRKGDVLLRAQ